MHLFLLAFLMALPGYAQITYQEQAQRLQHISATLLDTPPVEAPVFQDFEWGIELPITYLPEIDSTVGGKEEDLPLPPVHIFPMVTVAKKMFQGTSLGLAVRGWAGYLPKGSEAVVGMDAEFSQLTAGSSAVLSWTSSGGVTYSVPIGVQYVIADITGAVTDTNADDDFSTKTLLVYSGLGYKASSPFWANILVGARRAESEFFVESDQTTLKFTDTLSDAVVPLFFEVNAGWQWPKWDILVSTFFVPSRVLMPRLTFRYRFGGDGLGGGGGIY